MLQNKLQMWQNGNWIINLFVLLSIFNLIGSQPCEKSNETNTNLPEDWPCPWNSGVIPFVFDMFSVSPNRLRSLVNKGHDFVEARSCLNFEEFNPIELANKSNFTYLFYTYSGVLEGCCLPFYTRPIGRRLVVITPVCTVPAEIGHVTFHAMGLYHDKGSAFDGNEAKAIMFPPHCTQQLKNLTTQTK